MLQKGDIQLFGNIIAGVIANVVFLLLVVAIGWVIFAVTRRRRLLRFFGILTSRRIIIYLSNLRIVPGGALGVDNRQRSYQGSAVTFGEMLVASRIRETFNYPVPSLSDRSGFLSKILISDVQVQIRPSPLNEGEIETSCSYITLGSPGYNITSKHAESTMHSRAHFQNDNQEMVVGDAPADNDTTHGFVERIIDRDNGRAIFYAAGLSELATIGATHFLVQQWEQLRWRYGNDRPFTVMLRFDPADYRRWSIVFER